MVYPWLFKPSLTEMISLQINGVQYLLYVLQYRLCFELPNVLHQHEVFDILKADPSFMHSRAIQSRGTILYHHCRLDRTTQRSGGSLLMSQHYVIMKCFPGRQRKLHTGVAKCSEGSSSVCYQFSWSLHCRIQMTSFREYR